jgi:hypothetical protein
MVVLRYDYSDAGKGFRDEELFRANSCHHRYRALAHQLSCIRLFRLNLQAWLLYGIICCIIEAGYLQ